MYDRILLPFDGSESATAVINHACQIADWADATIEVLFVADTTRDSVTVVEGRTVDALVQHGERVLEEATDTLDTLGAAYTTNVVQGNPAPTIADYAEEYDHDLVVLSSRGREGVTRALGGSVSEKVVRLSSVPVLTARMKPDEQLAFPYEDILIPTDGSAAATHAADHVLSLAAALGATVHVLSVVEDSLLGLGDEASEAEGRQAATEAVEDIVERAATHGVDETAEHVTQGTPAEAILDCIEDNDIDAVGMGTTGRRGTERILLGSVAEETVRSAPVPVITVTNPEE
jgi:nucleotide-binding universal stress UspA family protein